jgi:hypothetical protein
LQSILHRCVQAFADSKRRSAFYFFCTFFTFSSFCTFSRLPAAARGLFLPIEIAVATSVFCQSLQNQPQALIYTHACAAHWAADVTILLRLRLKHGCQLDHTGWCQP